MCAISSTWRNLYSGRFSTPLSFLAAAIKEFFFLKSWAFWRQSRFDQIYKFAEFQVVISYVILARHLKKHADDLVDSLEENKLKGGSYEVNWDRVRDGVQVTIGKCFPLYTDHS